MKIYPVPVPDEFRPPSQGYAMPPHCPPEGYGVEQDFDLWLRQSDALAASPAEADWFLLQPFWNRLFIATWNWAQDEAAIARCARYIEDLQAALDFSRVFTICEWDLTTERPELGISPMTVFTAGRRDRTGVDVPLLCAPHGVPPMAYGKRHLASFVGNIGTSGWRQGMAEALQGYGGVHVEHAQSGPAYFREVMTASYVVLAPRGHRGQSFRFYEAMDMGVAPVLVGDMDTRPFKQWVDWDVCSYYVPDPMDLPGFLDGLDLEEAVRKGRWAAEVYHGDLRFGLWCRYVPLVLADML